MRSKSISEWLEGAYEVPKHCCYWCGGNNWKRKYSAIFCGDCEVDGDSWPQRRERIRMLRVTRGNTEKLNELPDNLGGVGDVRWSDIERSFLSHHVEDTPVDECIPDVPGSPSYDYYKYGEDGISQQQLFDGTEKPYTSDAGVGQEQVRCLQENITTSSRGDKLQKMLRQKRLRVQSSITAAKPEIGNG